MKSKIIILVFMLCVSWYSSIIAQRTCGSELNISFIQQTDPHRYQRIIALEHTTLQRIQSVSNTMTTNSSTIIIPVVVHVVYNTSNQNISENQINSQIQVLNEDFRRLNSDGVNTPTAFSGLASDVKIELRLASIDPNGNPTNGITRTSTTTTGFSWTADDVKNSSSGGQNAWDSRNYLNIWVCNITKPFAVLGYSQYPFDFSSSPNTDGVVIDFKNFGRDGSAISPYNKGRTATHEIGHWLNLFHIWGDDDDNNKMCTLNECNGTDHVDDTPNQGERNFGCPSFPRTDCCTPSGNGVMFMNYMDYTDDACMNLFTLGQKARMRSLFESGGVRESIKISGQLMFAEISGSSTICDQAEYEIPTLPNGAIVEWSLAHTGSGAYPQLIQNTPKPNKCTIINPHRYPLTTTLTANIMINGTNVISLNKTVTSMGNSAVQYGHYFQQGCVVNGITQKTRSGSFSSDSYFYLNQGCLAEITLYDMAGRSVSFHSGYPPGYWSYNSSNSKLLVRPAVGSSGVPTSFKITGGCQDRSLMFFTYSLSEGSMTLSPNPASDFVTVGVDDSERGEFKLLDSDNLIPESVSSLTSSYEIQLWNSFGLIKQVTTDQKSYQLDLTGVPPGFYYVHVIKDWQTYRRQLVVQ